MSENKTAVILIRGTIGANQDIKDTLKMLNLHKKNNCAILENNPVNSGMLKKVKDYTTFGEITKETEEALTKRKKNKMITLNPPKGGFERKGTKKNYTDGGALGKRDNMDKLLQKMM